MATAEVWYTEHMKGVLVTGPLATADRLRWLGDHARPCRRSGCKRPDGHNGRHYFNEDDVRTTLLHAYR